MIGQTISHFYVLEKLGGGGMGVVYLAEDTRLKRKVALKFLPPHLSTDDDANQRFVQEAEAASALNHANICTVHDIGQTDDGQTFIAMAHYEGETLKEKLQNGALPGDEALDIAQQVAEGLAAAHDKGIVHRDIKPANILITDRGRAIILDFGLAKLTGALDLTKSGSTVGTAYYMAPEQIRGEAIDSRTDLWSLGVILYEMLAGRRPFVGDYEQAVSFAILNQQIEPLEPDVPETVARTVSRLLSKDKNDRFESADEVVAALNLSGPFASGASDRSMRRNRTMPLRWLSVVVGIALVAALLLWTVLGRNGAESPASSEITTNPNLVVILPFAVQGSPDMQYLSEGMVTLLTTMLDGTGPIAVADHNAVISRLRDESGIVQKPEAAIDIANEFGASRVIVGSIVRAGSEVRMDARLYGPDASVESDAQASYRGDEDFAAAVDELAAELAGGIIANPTEMMASLAVGTTDSFEALKHYLNAQKLYTHAEFFAAKDEVEAALTLDSTFALAWYLHAEILGWVDVGGNRQSLEMARRYKNQLSGRARRMLDGRIAFDEGLYNDASQTYRGLIRDYPADIEAKGQLAEVLVHYEGRESAMWEALDLFEQIGKMAPNNQQFAMHHSDLLAMWGVHTGDFRRLDSLAAVYADLPLPEESRLDWSLALDQMSSDTRHYMVVYSRVRGTAEDSVASYELDDDPEFDAARLHWAGLLDAAEVTFATADPDRDPLTFNSEATYALTAYNLPRSRGQFRRSNEQRPELIRHFGSGWLLTVDILEGALSAFAIEQDSIRALRAALDQWDYRTEPLDGYESDGPAIKAYLAATLAWKAQDLDSFSEASSTFAREHPDTAADPATMSLARELDALDLWQQGDQTGAIRTMRQAQPTGIYFLNEALDPIVSRPQPSWYLAEMLEKAGRLEEAIDWYSDQLSFYWGAHQAPAWVRMASLHEQLGDNEEAIRYYTLSIDRWENADAFLQPRVAAMKERVDALVQASAGEKSKSEL